MILVDANLLLYAKCLEMSRHDAAREWLDERLNGSVRVGLPWPSLLAFMRIGTNPRVLERPLPMAVARNQVTEWLSLPTVFVPAPTPRHAAILDGLLAAPHASSRLVSDAHLAALAVEHGLTLCSTDADFARFAGLRWENPLGA